MFQNTASQLHSQTNSQLGSGSLLETDLKIEPVSLFEENKTKVNQMEEDLRMLKVSVLNVLHAFCALPNTNVSNELIESIQRGTISAMVLFLGRLVEKLDSYRVQQLDFEEMKGLLEDTSSMNSSLIAEKEMIKNEIIDVLETSNTYEEVKNRLVTWVNRADRGRQSAKRRRITLDNVVKSTKAKRVRSSQLRSRHPMYEVGSRSRTMQAATENNFSASRKRSSVGNQAADPDYVIEVLSTDEDSHNSSKEDTDLDQVKVNKKTKATGTGTSDSSLTRKRGYYSHFDKTTRFEIGRYASEHGTSKAVAHFTMILGHKVCESTVRGMAKQYSKGKLKVPADCDIEILTDEPTEEEGTSKATQTPTESDSCDMKEEEAEDSQADTLKQENKNGCESAVSASDSMPHWSTLVPGPGRRKRGQYNQYDEVLRAGIGRYAQAHGVAKAQRHFHEHLGVKVSESTIRGIRDQYQRLKEKGTSDPSVLPVSHRGAPTLLGNLDEKVQKWVNDTRMQGGLINTNVVVAAADNIVLRFAKHRLKRFGGDITITKHYARSLLNRMGLAKHRKSKWNSKLPYGFDVVKANFVSRLKNVVSENSVPESLIINWNQISCQLVPGGNWTSENSDVGSASGSGLDDKRQISVILAVTMSGKLLPPQIIYSGKTHRCLPKDVNFPSEWNVTYSDSQVGNEGTMLRFIDKIILPYIRSVRESLPTRDKEQQAIALFDSEEANNSQTLFKKLKDNHITIEFFPVNCTEHLQPIDLSVKEVLNDLMKQQFSEWYTKEFQSGPDDTGALIDMRTSNLKPFHAQWLINAHKDLEKNHDLIRKGFTKAGLLEENLSQVTSSSDATMSVA